MSGISLGTVKCQMKDCKENATIKMTFGPKGLGYSCFAHADAFVRELAAENMKAGATHAQTVDGYMRWRKETGHPVEKEEVLEWLKPL